MTRIVTLVGLCVTALVTSAVPAIGQSIQAPIPNQVFPAGPDYATDVLHDPWDYNNIEDIGHHPDDYTGWAQSNSARTSGPGIFLSGGRFVATNATGDPKVGLLYAGGVPDTGRSGLRYPVSTSLYRKLSFRMKATNAGTSVVDVLWSFGAYGSATGSARSPQTASDGDRIYQIDLVNNPAAGGAYTSQSTVSGFRLDPVSAASPAQVEIDWVRLTAADNSANAALMDVLTTGCGSRSVAVFDGVTTTAVQTNAQNRFNYGIFPPGSYQLLVSCNGSPLAPVPFTINDPPQVAVLQPSDRSGADYATVVRGNPWNMDDIGDLATAGNLDQGGFVAAPGGGLMLQGRNVFDPNPSVTGDPTLFWLYGEGGSRPIASTRYRYLTFTTQLHHAFDLGLGSVARIYWGSAPHFGGAATGTDDILVWPGRNTYTLDLATLTLGNGLEDCSGGFCSWTQGSKRFFRFDPHEFGDRQVVFDLDNVTLTAPSEVVQGQVFPIQWVTAGAGAGSINLYYDTDRNPASGRQGIASGIGIAQTSYGWNVGGLAPGDYYIYVEVNEPTHTGTDVRGAYSTGVLRVLPANGPGVVSIASHASGGAASSPFTISGCAYNGAGGADDEVIVYAHPLQGQMGGVVQLLGHNPAGGMGTLASAPCAGGLPGYQVSDIGGLTAGLWTFRVLGRNTLTGDFEEAQAQNVTVGLTAGAPRNFRASVSGNTVSLAWDPPASSGVTQYRIEAAGDPSFANFSWAILPPTQTSVTATLPNGTFFLRVRAGNTYSNDGPPSNVINFTLPGGGAVAPPGPITLGGQVNANPVALNWSQAGGGAAAYVLHAGTAPGASNLAVVPMGSATSLPPVVVPPGVAIFVRIVASNAAGSTVSNEVVVNVPALGPPGGPPIQLDPLVSGHTVTLRWNLPAGGAAPTSYTLVGRLPGSSAVLATAGGLTGTSLTVPGVPSGSYVITVVAFYGSTPSGESNAKALNVP